MYDLNDTIVAVSSPSAEGGVIVRITGPETIEVCRQIFGSRLPGLASRQASRVGGTSPEERSAIVSGRVAIDAELSVDAQLYLFFAPHSYTGDYLAEIHFHTNCSVTAALMSNLLGRGLRLAGPGEFTARAYLNGKIDLAQAEAVNEIVVSSNTFQLAAAERLLGGRLAETTAKVRSAMMDCLSLMEAGLDFSGDDIEFISRGDAVQRLGEIREELERLLSGGCCESVIDLPAVGIAGAPNAGKSSLVNKLLGTDRSIVSAQRKTTRDVLTGLLTLAHCSCVLFDCAGLICDSGPVPREPSDESILDGLAHQAAIESLARSCVVVFCVDVSKQDWSEDICIWKTGNWLNGDQLPITTGQSPAVIPVGTKSDLLSEEALAKRLVALNGLFAAGLGEASRSRVEFLPTSVITGAGLGRLRQTIDMTIVELAPGSVTAESGALPFLEATRSGIALTARHRQVVTETIENIRESINELKAGPPRRDEVAAMILRAAYQGICGMDSADRRVDEQILEKIFSHFCVGK